MLGGSLLAAIETSHQARRAGTNGQRNADEPVRYPRSRRDLETKFKQKTGATLPNSGDVATPAPKPLGPGQHAADIEPVPVVDLAISAPAAATPMTTETPRPRRR